jgi:hypothetical protein
MQTTGTVLLAVSRASSARVRTPAQDSRSAHGLLYLAAVRDDRRPQEHCPAAVDTQNWIVPPAPKPSTMRTATAAYARKLVIAAPDPAVVARYTFGGVAEHRRKQRDDYID